MDTGRDRKNPKGAITGQRITVIDSQPLGVVAARLRALGANVSDIVLDAHPEGTRPIERFIDDIIEGEYDDVVFSGAHGVRLITEYAYGLGVLPALVRALAVARPVAFGERTRSALEEAGVRGVVAASSGIDRVIDHLAASNVTGRTVGIQAAAPSEAQALAATLRQAGARVRLLSQDTSVDREGDGFFARLARGEVDAAVFGSARAVRWLERAVQIQGKAPVEQILSDVTIVAVEAAAASLRDRGASLRVLPARRLREDWPDEELCQLFAPSGRPEVAARFAASATRRRVVVVGSGMVGFRFCDRLTELDEGASYEVTLVGEEPRAAYDRVHLTRYFETRDADALSLAGADWYRERGVSLMTGAKALSVDTKGRVLQLASGEALDYDYLVLATGSDPFVPPVAGMEKRGVFTYRTIEDLDAIIDYGRTARSAAVIGGGLLGLEAAKAVLDLGLEVDVVECAPRLMPRQLDAAGASVLRRHIEALGVRVHLERALVRVLGNDCASGLRFADGSRLQADLVIVSAGVRPRDALARRAGLSVGPRGGIVVDDGLNTSDRRVFAIGECALHRGVTYGLVGPGYEMADVLASLLTGGEAAFSGADVSTKLKLLGIDVGSFGDASADEREGRSIVFLDHSRGVYKKLVVDASGQRVLGGMLVGDTTQYTALWNLARSGQRLQHSAESLLVGPAEGGAPLELSAEAHVCSCNNVSKGAVCAAIRQRGLSTVDEVKGATRAGTGCGGCIPLLTDVLSAELRAQGKVVGTRLCEHFDYSRAELFEIIQVKGIKTFDALLSEYGRGHGCEVCKPTVASIFASVFNESIVNHDTLQDTNDRFLANIQRGGLYSVVPRVPGGEITPQKLVVLGQVAERYGLYTKITGGQRIDLFGARLEDLPNIWEELVSAGFESGHAYGKAMRTVKSCVGTTWCRFGVQDSVGFAIRLENRYKGIRAPHKLKSAVSGCTRECAEARSKDFGLIATEKGWNIYVCGNGGAKPRHGDLLAADVDDETAFRYLDRFLMFYIRTADRLTRTSVWLERLEGGIEHLRDVIVRDSLGLCARLEADMQRLVETYRCEWADVVEDPIKRAKFRHFANSGHGDDTIELVEERGQRRPADWPRPASPRLEADTDAWVFVGRVEDFPRDGGMAVRHDRLQLAVFNFASRGKWYATENRCPHMGEEVLARGIIGDQGGVVKVACPVHKKTFSLENGQCLNAEESCGVKTFPVRVSDHRVFVRVPVPETEGLVAASRLASKRDPDTTMIARR